MSGEGTLPPAGAGGAGDGEVTIFEQVGGLPFFTALVERFYEGVATDPILRPMYPEDLSASVPHTAGFLAQYFGGGWAYYSEERGHPRLRMRHAPFPIDQAARDAWLRHMLAAVRSGGLPAEIEATMVEYFERASEFMINQEAEVDDGRRRLMVKATPRPDHVAEPERTPPDASAPD
jgi:hemoglobin